MDITVATYLAFKSYQEGNLDQAENIGRRILAERPENPDILHLMGVLRYRHGDYESGIKYIKTALKADPNFTEAYNNLGNIYQEIKQPDEAINYAENAIID